MTIDLALAGLISYVSTVLALCLAGALVGTLIGLEIFYWIDKPKGGFDVDNW